MTAGGDGPVRGGERVDSRRTIALHRVAAERAALMRVRRQRLTLMAAVFPVTVVLAVVFGGMWIAVQLLVDLGLAGYLVHLRRAAQVERRLAITRVSIERRIEAERVARSRRRPVGSSFAYHERDAGAQDTGSGAGSHHGRPQPAEELTPEELAHARAETIDLGGLIAAQHAYRDDAGQDEQPGPTHWTGGGAHPESPAVASVQEQEPGGPASGGHAKVLYGYAPSAGPEAHVGHDGAGYDYEGAGYDYEGAGYEGAGHDAAGHGAEYVEVEAGDVGDVGAAAAARMTARPAVRPPNRPTTSRPGRVQINPPGTHGGLIASPEAAPAGGSAAGDPAGENPGDIDPLLRRHAVGS
ncbi:MULTISPECIES: hypothetical protein [Frankia]|uniref:hypothetical protein n=1 Tax=Frankia alni TaxID=1859 RepID=UPI0002EAE3DE|nr:MULTISPECIES: hypothetical protein [Frankia]